MIRKTICFVFSCLLLGSTFLFIPVTTLAQGTQIDTFQDPGIVDSVVEPGRGFVPCSGTTCSPCQLVVLFNTVLKWFLSIVFLLFAVLAMIAGIKLVTQGSNSGGLTDAKKSFTNAFIGLIIILSAWLIVDTLMRSLVGNNGNIDGYGPWQSVSCATQTEAEITSGYFAGDAQYNPYTPPYALSSAGSGAGSCAVITDPNNPCSPANLRQYFGDRAEQASRICNKESGGVSQVSRTDRCCGTDGNCSGSKSFSGGFFQINILAHSDKIPNCNASQLYRRNGSSAQGNPIRSLDIVRNGVTIHTGWTCEIISDSMYNTCMQAASNPQTNFAVAAQLFRERGFQPWSNSARLCGIPQ